MAIDLRGTIHDLAQARKAKKDLKKMQKKAKNADRVQEYKRITRETSKIPPITPDLSDEEIISRSKKKRAAYKREKQRHAEEGIIARMTRATSTKR